MFQEGNKLTGKCQDSHFHNFPVRSERHTIQEAKFPHQDHKHKRLSPFVTTIRSWLCCTALSKRQHGTALAACPIGGVQYSSLDGKLLPPTKKYEMLLLGLAYTFLLESVGCAIFTIPVTGRGKSPYTLSTLAKL